MKKSRSRYVLLLMVFLLEKLTVMRDGDAYYFVAQGLGACVILPSRRSDIRHVDQQTLG